MSLTHRIGIAAAFLATIGAALAAGTAPASATTALPSCVSAGTSIVAGQYLSAPSFHLVMQGDGNLVEYDTAGHPLWDTQTAGNPGAWAVLQASDGNLVVYSATGHALWAAYPGSAAGDRLCMQGDGNVVIYSASNTALWATMSGPLWSRGNISAGNYYPSGQCTWWAEQQAAKYTGVFPRIGGDARYWAANASANRWHVDGTPRIGSVAVFQPGVAGAGAYGHVAWVTEVYPSRNAIAITEMNYVGPGLVDRRVVSPASGVYGLQYIDFPA